MAREEAVSSDLLTAVEEGDLEAVYRLCGEGQVSVTNKVTKATSCSHSNCLCSQHGESALHIAAGYGRLDMVRVLLESGASINLKDKVSPTGSHGCLTTAITTHCSKGTVPCTGVPDTVTWTWLSTWSSREPHSTLRTRSVHGHTQSATGLNLDTA